MVILRISKISFKIKHEGHYTQQKNNYVCFEFANYFHQIHGVKDIFCNQDYKEKNKLLVWLHD